jgi:excisionase family DNA binding protein
MQSVLIQNISSAELEDMISKAVMTALKNLNIETTVATATASDKLLTKKEAAAYLKISLPTLSKYINDGFVKAHTVAGTRMRFKISDLDKALKALRNR